MKCEYCGVESDCVEYVEDPYNSEILDDHTEHWLCETCIHLSTMEI